MRGTHLVLAITLCSCSSSSFDVGSGAPEDDGATEASAETSVTEDTTGDDVEDAGTDDTTITPDTGGTSDTRVGDSDLPDTKPPHPDTKPPPPDTAVTDSAPDIGPLCPRPASTKMYDVSTKTECTEIYTAYTNAVQGSLPCTCDADCSKQIDPNFCGCMRYVSPANDDYPLAIALGNRHSKLSCPPPPCPLAPCVIPTAGKCVISGSGKICQNAF